MKFSASKLQDLISSLKAEGASMKKSIKQKWLRALTSHSQTCDLLYRNKQEIQKTYQGKKKVGYCCLGVLASCQGAKVTDWSNNKRETNVLSRKLSAGLNDDAMVLLAEANDTYASFKQISRAIKEGIKAI